MAGAELPPLRCLQPSGLLGKTAAISPLALGVQAVVVDPSQGAPDAMRRQRPDGRLCAKFFGPAFNKVPSRPVAVPAC